MTLVKREEPVTAEFILSRISEYDIYHYECPQFILGNPICNWMRGEKHPSMNIFLCQDGRIRHHDKGDDHYRGDCWDLVCQKYGITQHQAIEHIANVFMITHGPGQVYKTITGAYSKPLLLPQRYSLIQCTVKKFTAHELNDYWGRYKVIGLEKLKKHEVYSIKEVYINHRRVPVGKQEMVFGYRHKNGWKVMFPERDRLRKWKSSIPLDCPGGLDNLNKGHDTLIVKSKKCFMVMEDLYPYLCYVQNESLGAVSEQTAKHIDENSKRVFYGGDADCSGKRASYRITEKYQWYHINTPDVLLPDTKDWSDWARLDNGLEEIVNHLNKKGLQ